MLCLEVMKPNRPNCGSIHAIVIDKSFVHYYNPLQRHLYKLLRKSQYVTLAIDTTGSLVKRLLCDHVPPQHQYIFLHEGVVHSGLLDKIRYLSSRCCWRNRMRTPFSVGWTNGIEVKLHARKKLSTIPKLEFSKCTIFFNVLILKRTRINILHFSIWMQLRCQNVSYAFWSM